MSAKKERQERAHGRELARRFTSLVAEILTAPPEARNAFDEVVDELGPWMGWGTQAADDPKAVPPPPLPRRFGDN